MPTPHVLLGDDARSRLQAGIDLLAQLVSLTLGPRAGIVASSLPSKAPEALTSSAVIARRIVEIPGRGANVGAMLLRHALWQMHERLGDGGATTAALAHALLLGGARQMAAGANPMQLRRGMERGLQVALGALREQARPLDGEQHMRGLAHAATGDPELSDALGAIFGRLGPEGRIEIEEYVATYVAHQFLEGASWPSTFVSPYFIANEAARETRLHEPYVLVTDDPIDQPEQIIPLLEKCLWAGATPLLILADDVTGPARALLLANRARGVLDVVAAKLTSVGDHRRGCYEDIAAITGARFISRSKGDLLENVEPSDLGRARIAQVSADKLSFVGTLAAPEQIEQRRQFVRDQLPLAENEEARQKLIERLGKLAGGVAVLKLGAASDTERAVRKELAERFIRFVPTALEEGVVPGGGAAYLACQSALDETAGLSDEEAIGAKLVRDALEAPMAWLARNANQSPAVVLAGVRRHGPRFGYNVLAEQIEDMWQANILDSAKVVRIALETAVSVASTALTTDAIVLRRKPIVAQTP